MHHTSAHLFHDLVLIVAASMLMAACTAGTNEPTKAVSVSIDVFQTTTTRSTLPTDTTTSELRTTTTLPPAATTVAAETTTTVPPAPPRVTTTTLAAIGSLASGLFCRDLFPLGYSYEDAVAYWIQDGRPDRMDADTNGIPCETVYDHSAVVAFWGDALTTTTAADVWYAVGAPKYDVTSLPGAGGYFGSGCSPGTSTLPDGIWFGRISAADGSNIRFDLMCFSSGLGGGEITNSNPTLRTVPVDSAAIVYSIIEDARGLGWDAIRYSTWLTIPESPLCAADQCLYWLYVNSGRTTEITEMWLP
jgi:hypothetical protein